MTANGWLSNPSWQAKGCYACGQWWVTRIENKFPWKKKIGIGQKGNNFWFCGKGETSSQTMSLGTFWLQGKKIILKTEVTILHHECRRQQIPRQSELSKKLVNMKKVTLELDNSALSFLYYCHQSKLWFFIWSSKHNLVNRFGFYFHVPSITNNQRKPKSPISILTQGSKNPNHA